MSRSWPRWRNEQPSADFFAGEIAAELIELSGDTGLAVFHPVATVLDGDLFGDVLEEVIRNTSLLKSGLKLEFDNNR